MSPFFSGSRLLFFSRLSQPQHRARAMFWLATVAVVAGCAVGPDFETPAAPEVDRYTAQPTPAQTASTPVHGGEAQALVIGEQLPVQWWQLFGSPKLDALVQQAFANSPTVLSARATLTQAQEILRAQHGAQVPTVDAGLGAQRQKTFMNFDEPSVIGPMNLYNAGVDVAYGVDLFGGLRRMIEAQGAQVDFQRYELQAIYLTLAGNVVTAAVQEASLREQLASTRSMLESQQERLRLSEKQFELGAIAFADVLSARSELSTLRAQLPLLQQELAAVQTQLAVYLGQLPMQRQTTDFSLDELVLPKNLPLGVPSELVRRRPDVLAAEATLHRASAEVGVATADLFPKFTLAASYGGQSDQFSGLFDNPIWSIGANLTQPLFHGGTLTAQRRAALAAFDAAGHDYRQAVLNAFKNVADSMQAVYADAEALNAQFAALNASEESLGLTEQQYRLGGVGYFGVLVVQRQAYQARINYVQRLASRYQNTAALMHALGGGWAADTDLEALSFSQPPAAAENGTTTAIPATANRSN